MDFETYDRMSDNPLNYNRCPNKCGITALIIEQDTHLECKCEWFQNKRFDSDDMFEDDPQQY